jgi:YD repeat-containing protein
VTRPDNGTQTNVTSQFQYQTSVPYQLKKIINEEGKYTEYTGFNTVHYLPTTISREGGTQTEAVVYDIMGNEIERTLPTGASGNESNCTTTLTRDAMYRVTHSTDPKGKVTQMDYDVDSHVTSVAPPAGNATTTSFDKRGFASGGSTPDGSWSQWVNANGTVRRKTSLRGYASNVTLDSLACLIHE